MELKKLLQGIEYRAVGNLDVDIADVTCDSRRVKKGSLFFCIVGYKSDGHGYAENAVKKGASALVVTRELDLDVPQIVVKDDRTAMAQMSKLFFNKPDEKMQIVGITGTNGKTTTTYLCAEVAKRLGKKVGIIGTICNYIMDEKLESANTTPESVELFRLFDKMVQKGVEVVFMEVSSHSLYLKRVYGVDFYIGVFTNLTQDHLDFHETMEKYANAKAILFENAKISIVNGDDPWGDVMLQHAKGEKITYGFDEKNDIYAYNVVNNPYNNVFDLKIMSDTMKIKINIPGKFSIFNGMCATAICRKLGYTKELICESLSVTKGVDGRCQVLKEKPFTVILDYAHTPDGLVNILSTFKGMGRIVCLFGCGGDRDPLKRPIMGEVAGTYSDFVVLTSDNPRFEEPMQIIKQVEVGLKKTSCDYVVIENRRSAIEFAVKNAKENDILILAGKGHETYQIIKGEKFDFDEKKIVNEILNNVIN